MCNHYRLRTNEAEVAAVFGIRAPYEADETFPAGDIFPSGKKTPSYGTVIVQDGAIGRSSAWIGACQPRCRASGTRRPS